MKQLTVKLCAAVALASIATFGAQAQEAKTISIAYSVDVLDETQNQALDAMKSRVEEINASRKDVKVTLDVYDAQSSVDKQISDVQTALIKSPNVLILSAVDAAGSLPAAQAAKDAGIPVIDRRPSDPEPDVYSVAFYAYDEVRYAEATTNWIKKYLDANPGKVLNVGLVYGAPAQTAQLRRADSVKELAKQQPDRIKIVAEGYGNWLTATAQNLTQDWLLAHPDINLVVCANDIMALGASNALQSAGRTDVMVTGYDLTDDGVQRVSANTQTLTVGTVLKDSNQIIDVAVGLAENTFKDKTFYVNPVYAIDPSNVADFLSKTKN